MSIRGTASAMIMPDSNNPPALLTKVKCEAKYEVNGQPSITLILNVNSDVLVLSFRSSGALTQSKLKLEYGSLEHVTGFARIIISGAIDGGPSESQSFTATGTWTDLLRTIDAGVSSLTLGSLWVSFLTDPRRPLRACSVVPASRLSDRCVVKP
ncbi:hypothetical protein C8R44DRAFT_882006 [Mycena epipterygia]|nr:hypothetical protein C8R44DRAFT_882006 [Mycena epipterygia]